MSDKKKSKNNGLPQTTMKKKATTTSGDNLPYPKEDGLYTIQYIDNKKMYIREAVIFNRAEKKWHGTKTPEFYDKNVISWFYGDITIPGKTIHEGLHPPRHE